MRYLSLLAAVVATAPLAVFAKGQLGYALGSRLEDGSCKKAADYSADFAVLKDTATIVRTYANVDQPYPYMPICYILGELLYAAATATPKFKVLVGLWAESEDSWQKDVDELVKYASMSNYTDLIQAVTVGSESLYRHQHDASTGLTADVLSQRIDNTKAALIKANLGDKYLLGTADSWNIFQDGTANPIIQNTNTTLLLVNAFGYWQKQAITNASATYLDDLQQAFGEIQSKRKSTTAIELWNGETGWPTTGGSDYGAATAGTAEAYYFWKQGVCAALYWNINVFYFEAFDEPWKQASDGADGTPGDERHWGAYDVNRKGKFEDYSCDYVVPSTS